MARRTRLRRRRSHTSKWKKVTVPLGVLLAVAVVAGGVAGSWAVSTYESAPPLSSLKPVQKGRSSAIYAADGSLIGFIQAENIRQPVPGRTMPQTLRDATVAIEDKNFFNHGALDPAGIARAAWKDLLAGGKPVQGASTITQQLVRNLYIQNPQETLKRKLIEAHLAYEMEDAHTKEWILTAYLNTAPYGTVEGETAVGVEAAAQTYFGKPANELGLTESALIAGLPQAPSEYNPFLDPHAALQRRNEVLAAMHEQDYIDGAEYREALHSGLGLSPGHKYRVIRDPFLFDLVQQELIDKYGINTVRKGGLKAYTTIDPELQERAQEAVDSCSVCYPEGGPAAGLASVNPKTGEIVALASTEGYDSESEFNYAWQAHRQPGSSFKTYVLTTAIKQGIDPASTYYDGTSPMTLETPGGGTWTVNNAEAGGGTMSLEEATWDSVNVIFAQLDLDVGPEERHQDRARNGHRSAARIGAGGGDRRSRGRRHAARTGRRLRDPGQRRHPPRPDRDQPGRIPQRQGRGNRPRLRRTGADRGPGLRRDQDPRGRDHPGHRRRLHLHGLRRRGRQDRHLGGPLRRLVRRLHAALLDRGLGRPPAVARSNRLRRADGGADLALLHGIGGRRRLPRIPRTVDACPNSSGLDSGHTSGSYGSSERIRIQRIRRRRSERRTFEGRQRRQGRRGGAAPEGEAEAAPEAAPEPAPTPAAPPPAGGGISPG